MKIIEQESKYWGECPSDLQESVLWIEKAGRVCYRSEDKIIEGSGIEFVNGIFRRKHYSVIEHSNLVLRTKQKYKHPAMSLITEQGVFNSPFFRFCIHQDRIYIAGNWRTWIEWSNRLNPDEQIKELEQFINVITLNGDNSEYEFVHGADIPIEVKAITAEFTTDRAVTHELVRHRPASYSQESQRYVRYDGGMKFIRPAWWENAGNNERTAWKQAVEYSEQMYIYLRKCGMKPEDARTVLPNSTATKIVMTALISEWKHVFSLRLSKAAYPMIHSMLQPIHDEMSENGWL